MPALSISTILDDYWLICKHRKNSVVLVVHFSMSYFLVLYQISVWCPLWCPIFLGVFDLRKWFSGRFRWFFTEKFDCENWIVIFERPERVVRSLLIKWFFDSELGRAGNHNCAHPITNARVSWIFPSARYSRILLGQF